MDLAALVDQYLGPADGYVDLVVGVQIGDRRFVGGTNGTDGRSIFRIASISKILTALAAVSVPGLGLDDPVQDHLPDVQLPTWPGEPIRIVHLATHTSGIGGSYVDADLDDFEAMKAGVRNVPLTSRPGEVWEYSNLGAVLLSWAAAHTAGTTFEDLVRDAVTGPFGLVDTCLVLEDGQKSRWRKGHDADGNPCATPTYPLLAGSGGYYSTADDLLTLMTAPTSDLARRQHFDRGDGAGMGLGWLIDPLPSGVRSWWHNGALPGYRSYAGCVPVAECAVVVLTNTTRPVDRLGMAVLDGLVAASA
jgi:D-alanyl-D-alanine-carboxypeptidase/D-alanyl-D-alanine-endopeptidase